MKKLLIIAQNWPAPDYSAAGVRLMQLVTFFLDENYKITIASTAEKREGLNYAAVDCVSILLNDASFDSFIQELQPDIVLFDRFMSEEQFGWRVTEHVSTAIKMLDTEDLHSLRKSREAALKKNISWSPDFWQHYEMTKREVASILRCDLSLIISSFEIRLLVKVLPNYKKILLHLPFMVKRQTNREIVEKPKFKDRKDFIFIGFGGHAPNIDAILFLKKNIWPLIIKDQPRLKLHIYGGNFPPKIVQLHNPKEGFLINGWAKSAQEVISNARVLLAPLRFGAGQKGKLLDAMCCGTPSVTSSIGAEGMHGKMPWNGQIYDDPKAFAKAAIETYTNEVAWLKYQENGQQILSKKFDKNKLSIQLKTTLETIEKDLQAHRNSNFIGNLLQHQTLASTKYMSKWIEAKNRK